MPAKTLSLAVITSWLWLLGLAQGQSVPPPKITQVMPCGGQVGSSFELTIAGTDLDKVEGLYFSFAGARAEVLPPSPPPADADKKKKAAMKVVGAPISRKFKVTLPAGAPVGTQDVRVITAGGVSNPRAFVLSDMREIVEQEPNDNIDKAQKVEINTSISGVVATPTDVDYFQFSGTKGQRVLMSCLTTSIDSKLPVQLELFAMAGKLLGSARNYQNNDALLDVTLPEDGAYLLRLSCFTYTLGGPDYFYRLTIGTAPWIDAIVPSVVEAGKETQVTIFGRNLPQGQPEPAAIVDGKMLQRASVAFKSPSEPLDRQRSSFNGLVMPNASGLDGFEFRSINASGTSNPYLLTYASGPVTVDNGNNNSPQSAQAVQAPGAVAGRILKKGDRHFYAVTAKKGQVLNFDLISDRQGAPSDLYLEMFAPKGPAGKGATSAPPALLSKQEDTPDNFGNQFPSSTIDPPNYRFVAPADGIYHVAVGSVEAASQFGPRHTYTLNITGDDPDFRLVAMPMTAQGPEAVTVNQGGSQVFSLFVWRLRGFTGDITVAGKDLPPGITVTPQVIAGNQKQTAFVVSASADTPHGVSALKIIGTAVIQGREVTREVRSATITWAIPQQQNIPVIARLDRELIISVRDRATFHLSAEKDHLVVPQGDKLTFAVKLFRAGYKGGMTLVPVSAPVGMVMQPVNFAPDKDSVQVALDSKATVLPGNYTLVLRGQSQDPKGKQPAKPGDVNSTQAVPPIALTVVPKQLAKLVVPANLKVALGKEVELLVRLNRQYDYAGTFKIEVILPPSLSGLLVEPITIKGDENEAKLQVQATMAAPLGQTTVLVRITGLYNGTLPVVQESKLSVTVTK